MKRKAHWILAITLAALIVLPSCTSVAGITEEERALIQDEAVRIFRRLGCSGLVRMDFILSRDGKPFLLEINPNPGMTEASLVPQMVRKAGMTMEDFLTAVIDGN